MLELDRSTRAYFTHYMNPSTLIELAVVSSYCKIKTDSDIIDAGVGISAHSA